MDIDKLNKLLKEQRSDRFNKSNQYSLGIFIESLELLPNEKQGTKDEKTVRFDFEYAIPTRLSSWRGDYSELAICFDFIGYDNFGKERPKDMTLSNFIALLKSAIGSTYEGWKGGEFIMNENTPLWVANDGNVGETAIVGIKDDDYEVILLTGLCEY